jgi:hypothetical protein
MALDALLKGGYAITLASSSVDIAQHSDVGRVML